MTETSFFPPTERLFRSTFQNEVVKTETFKLDRIEEGFAVMECPRGKIFSVAADSLPENSKSGDCFVLKKGVFVFCGEETEKRRKAILALANSLVNKKR